MASANETIAMIHRFGVTAAVTGVYSAPGQREPSSQISTRPPVKIGTATRFV
jgi:hypothetical protein